MSNHYGLGPIWTLIVVSVLFILGSYAVRYRIENYWIYAYMAICLYFVHIISASSRMFFIRLLGVRKYFWIEAVQNGFLLLPAFLFLALNGHILWGFGLLLLGSLLPVSRSRAAVNYVLPTAFFSHPYEYIVGIRRYWWLYLFCITLAIIGIIVENPNLMIGGWIFAVFLLWEFLLNPQDDLSLPINIRDYKGFLLYKMAYAIQYAFYMVFPFFILGLAIDHGTWWTYIVLLCWTFLSCVTITLLRYSSYPRSSAIPDAFVFAFTVIIPPIGLFSIPYFYNKCKSKLIDLLP